MGRKGRTSMNNSIKVTYTHVYNTEFLIDESKDFDKLKSFKARDYERRFYVFDANVYQIYGETLLEILEEKSNYENKFLVEAKEYSKSIEFYPELINWFEEHGLSRYDAVVTIGGGILIDLVSFSVSTYMRGVPLFIIATTLIGQTDASTAGKTCLNTKNGKNVLGTFYYPQQVYNNIPILFTNKARFMRQGLSEAFKYGLLADKSLVHDVVEFQNGHKSETKMSQIVYKTIQARIKIREIDPLASNLGHTFGHAMEKYFNYNILHGDAIAAGTVLALFFAVRENLLKEEICQEIWELMKAAHLNIYLPYHFDVSKLIRLMRKDKKSSASRLHLVLITDYEKLYKEDIPFYTVEYSLVESFLNNFCENYAYKRDEYEEFLQKEILR